MVFDTKMAQMLNITLLYYYCDLIRNSLYKKVIIKNQIHNVPIKAKFGHFWVYFDDSNTLLVEVLKVTPFCLCQVYKGKFTSIMYPLRQIKSIMHPIRLFFHL